MLVSRKGDITSLKVLCSALNLLRPKQHCLNLGGEPRIIGQAFNSTFFKENVRTKFMNFQAFTFCLIQPISKVSVPSLKNSISSVQSLSHVRLFATPWTAAQASLTITNSQSLLKLVSIESVMPSNYLILCHPLLPLPSIFPSIRVFSSQFFSSGGQSIGVSASTSILPMNTQDWFPLGWTGWISFQSKGLSRVFSNTTVQKHQFFATQLSL